MLSLLFDWLGGISGYKQKSETCQAASASLSAAIMDLQNKVKAQNDLIYQLQKTDDGKAQKIVELSQELTETKAYVSTLSAQLANADASIESLKTELALQGDIPVAKPEYIDEGRQGYLPVVQFVETQNNQPKVNVCTILNPRDIYNKADFMETWARGQAIRKLTPYQKLMAVWQQTINVIKYEYDWGDSWQLPVISKYRGKGDCLPKDTFLLTSEGKLVEIGEVHVGAEIIGYNGEPTKVTNKWDKGKLQTMRFVLSNKSVLECTSEHKVFAKRTTGVIEIRAADLKIGDEILSIDKLRLKDANSQKMELDLIKLYGLHIADGWCEDYRFAISGKDGHKKEQQKMWVKEFCEKHNVSYRWHERYISINDKSLASAMEDCGHTAINKQIPFGLGLGEFEINALLDGLRADAYMKNHQTWIHRSISRKLITQIRILYKQLGIQTSIKFFEKHGGLGKNPIYDLTTRNNQYPLLIVKIDEGRETECFDIETENHGIYLPESDVIVHNCEDGSVYFVCMARSAGIPADRVYLAIGPTSFGYHAYPIAYLDENDAQEAFGDQTKAGWYIFESTLDYLPSAPMRLMKSNYQIDNGLQNWKFAGQISPKFQADFNAVPQMPGNKIERGKAKRDKMLKLWRGYDGYF